MEKKRKRIRPIDHRTEIFTLRIKINELFLNEEMRHGWLRRVKASLDALESSIYGYFEDNSSRLKKDDLKGLETINKELKSNKTDKVTYKSFDDYKELLTNKYEELTNIMRIVGYIQVPKEEESY